MYLDVKYTVWERIEFESTEEMNLILEKLKKGEIEYGWEVVELLGNRQTELLLDSGEEMTVEDNEGYATLELYDEQDTQIWNNVKP